MSSGKKYTDSDLYISALKKIVERVEPKPGDEIHLDIRRMQPPRELPEDIKKIHGKKQGAVELLKMKDYYQEVRKLYGLINAKVREKRTNPSACERFNKETHDTKMLNKGKHNTTQQE